MTTPTAHRGLVDPDGKTLLERAHAAVPGLDHLRAQSRAVAVAVAARPLDAPDPEVAALAAAVEHAAHVADGHPADPDHLAQLAADAWAGAQRDNLARAALRRLDNELTRRAADLLADHVDQALDVVRAHLADVLDTARPVLHELDGIDSADAAITAGLVEQWQHARTLAEQYSHAREVQRVVVTAAGPARDRPAAPGEWYVSPTAAALVDRSGHQSDAPEVLARLVPGADPAGGWRLTDRDIEQAVKPPWLTGTALDQLRHAATTPTTWVPTIRELRATDAACSATVSAARESAYAAEAAQGRSLDGPSASALREARGLLR